MAATSFSASDEPSIIISPPSAPLLDSKEPEPSGILIIQSVAVILAPTASLCKASTAYPSDAFLSLQFRVDSDTVTSALGAATLTTLRPVRVDLLIVTFTFGAEAATLTA